MSNASHGLNKRDFKINHLQKGVGLQPVFRKKKSGQIQLEKKGLGLVKWIHHTILTGTVFAYLGVSFRIENFKCTHFSFRQRLEW